MRNCQRIESPDGQQLAFSDQPSWLTALLGTPFVAVGVYMLGMIFFMWAQQLGKLPYDLQAHGLGGTVHSTLQDYWAWCVIFIVGCMFLFFGLAMALFTTGTHFDVAKGAVVNWWRILLIKREQHYRVQDFSRVEVVHRRKTVHSRPIFFVSVKGLDQKSILIKTCRELDEANQLARDLAARLKLNLILLEASL